MSSHREAPAISKDPVADNTDLYAFVSPGNTVTLIANYLPLELPAGGPNFFEFGDDVLYNIYIDNNGDSIPEITFQFQFTTSMAYPDIFLYNVGPISFNGTGYTNLNRYQTYTVTRFDRNNPNPTVLGRNLIVPPCNVGVRSTPMYPQLAQPAVQSLGVNGQVFAGQRADGFYVDLGSIFDLGDLRPFSAYHALAPKTPASGVNAVNGFNVQTIALQVPIQRVTANGQLPSNATDPRSVIGVWASSSRKSATMRTVPPPLRISHLNPNPVMVSNVGPDVQVSRLGNPLFNEVITPMGKKDFWNSQAPAADSQFLSYVQAPALAALLPTLYPGVFPNLANYTKPRADLVAILLTGIPNGVVPGFPGNYTGPVYADQLRLNLAIPPSTNPNIYGLLGGDIAGFPNGRRVFDDVTTIEVRAIAGAVLHYVDGTFTPDATAAVVSDFILPGSTPTDTPVSAAYAQTFPYLGTPFDGYTVPPLPPTPNSGC